MKFMKLPFPRSQVWSVLRVFHERGSMSMDDAIKIHGKLNNKLWNTRVVYERGVAQGWLLVNDGIYSISKDVTAYFNNTPIPDAKVLEKESLVQPRTPSPFKPLSAKYIPSMCGTRDIATPSNTHFYVSGTSPQPCMRGVSKS